MPPKKQDIINAVKDEDHFMNIISPENKKLVLFDVHQEWCGPCTVMEQTYKSLQQSIDDFEKRVEIFTLNYSKIVIYKNDKFNRDPSSKPRFLLYSEGKIIDEVNGADIPALMEKVTKNLPMMY